MATPQPAEEVTPPAAPAAATAPAAQIEIDPNSLDDPAFDEQLSTFTESLSPSVVDYPVEHGRRYHAYRAGVYVFPNDERELGRLDMTHLLFFRASGDKLYLAPIDEENTKTILDLGTGTGVWAIEMGDLFPGAEVIGNDLSPVQTSWVPPNVKFEVDDIESEWTYDFKFDFIFCRYLVGSIADWPKLVGNVFENLNDGAWAEFSDLDLTYLSDDGSYHHDTFTQRWATAVTDVLEKIGRDPKPGKRLRSLAEKVGFVNIHEEVIKLPIGPWPKDPTLKEVGMINLIQLLDGLEGFSLKALTIAGYTEEEIKVLTAKVRSELKAREFHAYYTYHIVYGQKPTPS